MCVIKDFTVKSWDYYSDVIIASLYLVRSVYLCSSMITHVEVFIGSKYKICGGPYVRDVISSATIASHYLLQWNTASR